MIDKFEAEIAIKELADRIPEEDESMIGTMEESNCTCPSAYIKEHREWRETGGIPHFRATIHYPPEQLPIIGGQYIQVKVEGTFKQSRQGLTVENYGVTECEIIDEYEEYAPSR